MNELPTGVLFSAQNAGGQFSDGEWRLVEAAFPLEGDFDTFVPDNVEKALRECGAGEDSYVIRHRPNGSSDIHELCAFVLCVRGSPDFGWVLFATWTFRDDDISFILDRAKILQRGEIVLHARQWQGTELRIAWTWLLGWLHYLSNIGHRLNPFF